MILDILKRRVKELERKIDTITLTREVKAFVFDSGVRDDDYEYTLAEIAQFFGVSRTRAAQIENSAIKKLKHPRIWRTAKVYVLEGKTPLIKEIDSIDFEQFIAYGSGVSIDHFKSIYPGVIDEKTEDMEGLE